MGRGHGIYIGLFLISAAALMFEVALTRILAVAFWHHFAFLVISIALFGIAASGTYLTLFPMKKELGDSLSLFSLLFSISIIGGFAIINNVSFDPFRFFVDKSQVLLILLYYMLLSIPFFFLGLCIALSFTKRSGDAGKLYFSNLTGSGIGALGVLALFSPFGGSGVLIFSAALGLSASFFFSEKRRYLNGAVLIVLLVLLLVPISPMELNMSPYKPLNLALRYPDSKLISTEWNAISRVDVLESGFVRYAPGLSLNYQKPLPPQIGIAVDGGDMSAVTRFNGSPLEFTGHLTSALPYFITEPEDVLVIEAGGGLEIVQARSLGAGHVAVLESNPLVIETVKSLQNYSSVYSGPGITVIEGEARPYLRGGVEEFDLILIGASSAAPTSSTGVYALTENYLFTVEAFKDIFTSLSDGGFLMVTMELKPPPRESLRTVALAAQALSEVGTPNPEENIAVIRSLTTITLVVKKTALTSIEIERIREFSAERGFDLVYLPGIVDRDANIYNRFPEDSYYRHVKELLLTSDPQSFYDGYLYDVRPPTDEKPFFSQFLKPGRLAETYRATGEKWQIFVEGGYMTYLLLIQAGVLALAFILLPLAGQPKTGADRAINRGSLAYFFFIGIGFMFVEIPLIQRFILFLGKPVYAVSTVLFGLLISSGIGSLHTARTTNPKRLWKISLILLIFLVTVYTYLPQLIFGTVKTGGLWTGYALSVALLFPLGFLMGTQLPLGIKSLKTGGDHLIPWAWAANGSASVLASILAVIIAMQSGFTTVMILGAIAYGLALACFIRFFQPRL